MSPLTLRLKRNKQTYFVTADSTDSVSALKGKFLQMLGKGKNPREVRLQVVVVPRLEDGTLGVASATGRAAQQTPVSKLPQAAAGGSVNAAIQYSALDDSAILEQLGLVDDGVVFFTFWLGDDSGGGSWEQVSVPEVEPLDDDDGRN
ncbi:hypothetical protein HDU82_005825 [Entophlyctis luteolus]|nr:hypothetical protein HDU82_005825 [Entophlyctis luteolus]KAJ3393995.1 hypothetical protein HDU84_000494 [Entophlyctis sp. JEL0112]